MYNPLALFSLMIVLSAEVVCKLQPDAGRCKGYFPRYFFNHTSGQCEKFIYGGCEGNSNRFHTIELCQKKCQPGKLGLF